MATCGSAVRMEEEAKPEATPAAAAPEFAPTIMEEKPADEGFDITQCAPPQQYASLPPPPYLAQCGLAFDTPSNSERVASLLARGRYSMTISIGLVFVLVKGLSALGIVDFSD